MPSDDFAECVRSRPLACKPYAQMHGMTAQVAEQRAAILVLARARFVGYDEAGPGYLAELEASLAKREAAWAAYRDAQCEAQPYVEGMSRAEAPDLTEASRLELMGEHLAELEHQVKLLKE